MLDFIFYNPTRVIFGKDRLALLHTLIPAEAKVLLTYGGGSAKKYGTLDAVKSRLGTRTVYEFGGIEPNPRYETLMKAVDLVRREQIDCILAVGGGSVVDGSKFIAAASLYAGDTLALLLDRKNWATITAALPVGVVLTLSATGSEMNERCVVSHGRGKYPLYSEHLFPKFSLLDPSLTFTLPSAQIANGVVDTFAHIMEQYITYPVGGLVQERMAEGILQTLIEIGETTLAEPDNYEARANLVWSAALALSGVVGSGVPQDWSSHRLGHEITALFGVDHGQTLAIVLPALMDVRREKKRARLLQYAERIWHLDRKDEDRAISAAIEKTREFFERLGVRTHLSDYGIRKDQLGSVVENLREHGNTALSETGDLTLDISLKILERAL